MADESGRNPLDRAWGTGGSGPIAGERSSFESELIGARRRMQSLLAVSPAIIYTTQA
jgi:hypothetical protein